MDEPQLLRLVDEILEVAPGSTNIDDDVRDKGWDSLASIGFIAAVDDEAGVTLDAERFAAARTPREFLTLINEAKDAG